MRRICNIALLFVVSGILFGLATASSVTAAILYADPSVAIGSGNDCLSWGTACALQDALANASSGDEIWVMQGTHYPGTARTDTFQLKSGVAVYGGFAGTETQRSQRNWQTNVTTLSGDIGTSGDSSDNTYRVVTGADNATLDGFTITGGNADGSSPYIYGGGMYNYYSSPTVTNCTFSGNSALSMGGGMYNKNSNPTVTNCTFSGNSTAHGGGMFSLQSNPTVTNCTFSNNLANGSGGGMRNTDSSPTVTNCTFSGNSASLGGGMYNKYSSPTVANTIMWGDTASSTGPEIYNDTSAPAISYSDIEGCGGSGGGWDTNCGADNGSNIDADPLFVDQAGGDLHLQATSPAIDTGDNSAVPSGVTSDLDGNPRIVDGDNDSTDTVDMGAYEYQQVPEQQAAVPTITEWGMILFMALAGLCSLYYMRRQGA